MMFLKNAWYVAAWDHEVTRTPRPAMILGQNIVLFRTVAGMPVALEDACPHRKLPLSKGRVVGDTLQCGYHGMTFDGTGRCVRVSGQNTIPPGARVGCWPLEEKYGLVWIWMGDAAADPTTLIDIPYFDDPAWGMNQGQAMEFACNYLFITDNLLDPTHVAYVHPSSFGSKACENVALTINAGDDGVIVSRWMIDSEVAPFYRKVVPFDGNCDRKQHYEVRYPGNAIIKAIFAPAGCGGEAASLPDNCFLMDSYNFMTPVNETTTRYYWFQLRNLRPDDEDLSQMMTESIEFAFNEDRAVLAEVQKGMSEKQTPNINIAIDAGPQRFRKRLEKLIRAEQDQTSPA